MRTTKKTILVVAVSRDMDAHKIVEKENERSGKCAVYEGLLIHFYCLAFSDRGCSIRKNIADPLCLFSVYRTISISLSAGPFVFMYGTVRHRGLLDRKKRSREHYEKVHPAWNRRE